MAKLILVTTGTSALEKALSGVNKLPERDPICRWHDLEELTEKLNEINSDGNLTTTAQECYEVVKAHVTKYMQNNLERYFNGRGDAKKLSAELASLLAMENEKSVGKINNDDKIILLNTDTMDGILSAEVNAVVMKSKVELNGVVKKESWNVEINEPITDLKILENTKPTQFINGLRNLRKSIKNHYKTPNYDKKVTITSGGYKGLLITTAWTTWESGGIVIYVFEKSSKGIILSEPSSSSDGLGALG